MTDSADDPCDGIGSDTLSGWLKKPIKDTDTTK